MGQVNVTFIGICTHYVGMVPGIPHRVVLPDASALRFGIVMIVPELRPDLGEGSTPNQVTYFLMPHFSILRVADPVVQESLAVRGVMQNGNVFSGVRLAIANAKVPEPPVTKEPPEVPPVTEEPPKKPPLKEPMLTYDPGFFDNVPRITSYVESYAYSPEVVLGGLAGVYFDLFCGHIKAFPEGGKVKAIDVTATIETNGAPELLATPFVGGKPELIRLVAQGQDPEKPVELYVANQGMDCDTQENSYDFLLHYLTSRIGIPRRFTQRTPGMGDLTPFTPQVLAAGAETLKTFDFPKTFDSPCLSLDGLLKLRNSFQEGSGFLVTRNGGNVFIVSVACSNSQYP